MINKIKKKLFKKRVSNKIVEEVEVTEKPYLYQMIDLGMKVGEGCEIFPNVNFGSEPYLIKIGNNVRITNGVTFMNHDGGVWTLRRMGLLENADIFGKIEVGDNTHIGMNAFICPGVKIGKNCIIGVGSVVTKDIPDNSVAAGVPARVIKSIDDYYEKHKETCDFTKHMGYDEKREYLYNKYNLWEDK